jgi:hypothetical protein
MKITCWVALGLLAFGCSGSPDDSEIEEPEVKGDAAEVTRPRGTFTKVSGEAPFEKLGLRFDDEWFVGEDEGGELGWSRSTTSDARYLRLLDGGELKHRFAWTLRGEKLTLRDTKTGDEAKFERAEEASCRYDDDCALQGYAGKPSCLGSWSCGDVCRYECEQRDADAILDCRAERIYDYTILEESFTEWEYPSLSIERAANDHLDVYLGSSHYTTGEEADISQLPTGEWIIHPYQGEGGDQYSFRLQVGEGGTAQRRGTLAHKERARDDYRVIADVRCW